MLAPIPPGISKILLELGHIVTYELATEGRWPILDLCSQEASSLWMERRSHKELALCREYWGSFSTSLRENQQGRGLLALTSSDPSQPLISESVRHEAQLFP